MGKIRVSVSQAGGQDDNITLGSGPVNVNLTSEDGTSAIPSGMQVTLTVGRQNLGTDPTPTTSSASDNLSYPFTGDAVNQPYTVSITGAPSGTTFDGLTGTVAGVPLATESTVKDTKEPSKPAGGHMSFWQKIMQFFRRLFGFRML